MYYLYSSVPTAGWWGVATTSVLLHVRLNSAFQLSARFKKMNTLQIGCVAELLLLEDVERNKKKTSRKRWWWTHPTLPHRLSIGNFHTSFNNHRIHPETFFQYYTMSVTSFDELLGLLGENIMKQDTIMSIHPAERHCIKVGAHRPHRKNFSESNIVHKNLNAALGQPNETPECRLHNFTSACVDNASYHVGIAWRWANAKLKASEALVWIRTRVFIYFLTEKVRLALPSVLWGVSTAAFWALV